MHSFKHDNFEQQTKETIYEDVQKCIAVFDKYNLPTTYFRPPFGIINKNLCDALNELGIQGVIWSIDSQDWNKLRGQALIDNVLCHLTPGSIILLHDPVAVEDVERLIDEIEKRGYAIVPLYTLMKFKSEYPH